MTEHPILFSAAMVRRLLSGDKVQTRRVIKPQPEHLQHHVHKNKLIYEGEHRMWCWKDLVLEDLWDFPENEDRKLLAARCPHGRVGNRLWVKETFALWRNTSVEYPLEWETIEESMAESLGTYGRHGINIAYRADGDDDSGWRPSLFMPRWASRITLEITDVRVQKLQEISEEDATSEGIHQFGTTGIYGYDPKGTPGNLCGDTAKFAFQFLWDSINGDKYPFSSNPFVWAISFKRVER